MPDGNHACSSSHGSRGCFHVIQPIRWACLGASILLTCRSDKVYPSTCTSKRRLVDVTLQQGDHAAASGRATLSFTCRVTVCGTSEATGERGSRCGLAARAKRRSAQLRSSTTVHVTVCETRMMKPLSSECPTLEAWFIGRYARAAHLARPDARRPGRVARVDCSCCSERYALAW